VVCIREMHLLIRLIGNFITGKSILVLASNFQLSPQGPTRLTEKWGMGGGWVGEPRARFEGGQKGSPYDK